MSKKLKAAISRKMRRICVEAKRKGWAVSRRGNTLFYGQTFGKAGFSFCAPFVSNQESWDAWRAINS